MEKKNEYKWISIRLTADEKEKVSTYSKSNGVNISALLRSYLMGVVDNVKQN